MIATDFFKQAVEALEFCDHVSALCGSARTVYETDRDTLKKVFDTYFEAAATTRKRWVYGDEENGQGVYVEWRGRRFGQGPELWAVTRLSMCLNKSGTWELEPQPSSRDDAFIARCRWRSMGEALDAALRHKG